ncbi:MAG: tRNA (N6-isopentenyl adenosine(37)-C2)-methylthiotransferase MiaB [Ruminococcaceae bacterium]|nr:tRNA (N6-isopentenyl adenosine(37)-C2)-methylthiotransferase MiaB [Oscillospiraceae bacterium]
MEDNVLNKISANEIKRQKDFVLKVKNEIDKGIYACVITYGCQQNENDSEKLKAYLSDMGYKICDTPEKAKVIIFNTCAVREGAQERVYGNLGALKHRKQKEDDLIIGICGCMAQQEEVSKRIKSQFRHVDIVFGTHSLYRFPEIMWEVISKRVRKFDIIDCDGYIVEGIDQLREDKFRASVSIMYGCNNFCSYCIVPYVRGRERSRDPENIISEIKELNDKGYKEITLLGQNVNSYGKDLDEPFDFADLIKEVNKIDGIKRIKFMTSHPKDISDKLINAMAECEKVVPYLHLPFQSGSNRILEKMNRKYTREKYLDIIRKVREKIPNIALSSDVIVGFPNETYEDFLETLNLIKEVRFDTLFTFIYSKRPGTPAAKMEDSISQEEKHKNFNELLEVQNAISKEINDTYVGNTYSVLVEGVSKNNPDMMSGRTDTNKIINFAKKDAKEGDIVNVKVTSSQTWALIGEEV